MLITPTVASKSLTTEKKVTKDKEIEIDNTPVKEFTETKIIPLPKTQGILPAFAVVRCRWKIYDEGEGERTIHFWVFGYGGHELTWDTLDDFDGDGTWDLGPGTPLHYEWFAFLIPLRHYDDCCYWDGYPGRAKVKVMYTVDDNSNTKTFQEPL